MLESKKDQYSKRITEIVTKNYKNISEIIKSNSRIEASLKKFNSLNAKPEKEENKYEFEINYNNKGFMKKCENLIQEISSFLDNILSMYNNL